MQQNSFYKKLKQLYIEYSDKPFDSVSKINIQGGSGRQYFRIKAGNDTSIAVISPDYAENRTFLYLTDHFRKKGFNVPEILYKGSEEDTYLLEDLGDEVLFDKLNSPFDSENIQQYKEVIDYLVKFQIEGAKGLDFSKCYPRAAYDIQSAQWDMNYFKYMFLKLGEIPFDEQELEDDIQPFISSLCDNVPEYFMYRDFQSRNIMLTDGGMAFIDYQGGRKGPLQYDLASLLNQARAEIPEDIKEELIDYYLGLITDYKGIDTVNFRRDYPGWSLIRSLQTLGAYAYRGFYEGKSHFVMSMKPALIQALDFAEKYPEGFKTGHLSKVLKHSQELIENRISETSEGLTISINSFSYRKNIPRDYSGNGGGFVFDCRALPNPGRIEKYHTLTGLDNPVKEYLKNSKEVAAFIEKATLLIGESVDNYLIRGFSNLQINFGCTGGQHRSVYCAETVAEIVKNKYTSCSVKLNHTNKDAWPVQY